MADRNSGSCRVRGASLSRPRRFPNDHFGRRDEMKNGSLRMTPLLYVDEVEKSLPFWTDGLGFEKVMEVEDHNKLLFALLQKGEQELMLNARALIQRIARGRRFHQTQCTRLR